MKSQAEQILELIEKSGEDGIPNWRLSKISLQYNARIHQLRKDGYNIRNKRVYRGGKATETFNYYIEDKKPNMWKYLSGATR